MEKGEMGGGGERKEERNTIITLWLPSRHSKFCKVELLWEKLARHLVRLNGQALPS